MGDDALRRQQRSAARELITLELLDDEPVQLVGAADVNGQLERRRRTAERIRTPLGDVDREQAVNAARSQRGDELFVPHLELRDRREPVLAVGEVEVTGLSGERAIE